MLLDEGVHCDEEEGGVQAGVLELQVDEDDGVHAGVLELQVDDEEGVHSGELELGVHCDEDDHDEEDDQDEEEEGAASGVQLELEEGACHSLEEDEGACHSELLSLHEDDDEEGAAAATLTSACGVEVQAGAVEEEDVAGLTTFVQVELAVYPESSPLYLAYGWSSAVSGST